MDRGYGQKAALSLVANHHALRERQRQALQRSVSPLVLTSERRRRHTTVPGRKVIVDGFNAVINTEAGLGGAPLVRGRDGWLRNLAKIHGSYRLVVETEHACGLLLACLEPAEEVIWLLDRGVANSGRLARVLREMGATVSIADAVDQTIAETAARGHSAWVAATADTAILDRVESATDLPAAALASVPDVWYLEPTAPDATTTEATIT